MTAAIVGSLAGERALTSESVTADGGATSIARRLLRPVFFAGVSLVVILALWLGFIYALDINSYVAKSPIDVFHFFVNGGANGQSASAVYDALGQTAIDAGVGLVAGLVAAVAVALAFVLSRPVEQSFLPLAVILRSVPIVSMTPLITLLCGRDLFGVTVITGLVVFFPALVTMTFGLRSTPKQAADLCRAYGANSWMIVRKVMLPTSLPALFAAARVAVPGSLVGALLAEFLASGKGIGYLLAIAPNQSSYDTVWAAVTAVTIPSILGYYVVQAVETVVLARFGPA